MDWYGILTAVGLATASVIVTLKVGLARLVARFNGHEELNRQSFSSVRDTLELLREEQKYLRSRFDGSANVGRLK